MERPPLATWIRMFVYAYGLAMIIVVFFASVPRTGSISAANGTLLYLPFVARAPDPLPGYNESCTTDGVFQICAAVSASSLSVYSNLVVYGRLLISGYPQPNQVMNTTWKHKTMDMYCSTVTGADGVGACTRYVGGATPYYNVQIIVDIAGHTTITNFTPY